MTTQESKKARKQAAMIVHLLVVLLLCVAPMIAQAADIPTAAAKPINLSIGIGGVRQVSDLPQYLGVLYRWFVGAAMVIAAFMITLGGFQYVASAGIPKYVGMAKQRIINGLMGLLLVIGSYVLLNSINPAFTQLKLPDIRKIENIPLPSDTCENTGNSKDKYKCGQTYKGAEGGQPPGKQCIGIGQCGTGKCLNTSGSTSEVSWGSTQKTVSFSCVNASKCSLAQGNPSCAGITFEIFGEAWKEYCNSGICNAALGEKNGCYAVDVVVNGSRVRKCEKLGGPGDICTLTPCAEGLLCNTATTFSTCTLPKDVADGEACKRNAECKSGMCNKYVGLSVRGGLCAPAGGYKTLTGDARFAECDNATPQLFGESQPAVCGDGWQCVDHAPNSPVDYVCSDLDTGSPCKDACKNASDECLVTSESVLANAPRTACAPRATPPTTPPTPPATPPPAP